MADTINKQKKSRSQRRKSYYAAQFARTAKNKMRKIKRAKEMEIYHVHKRARRAANSLTDGGIV